MREGVCLRVTNHQRVQFTTVVRNVEPELKWDGEETKDVIYCGAGAALRTRSREGVPEELN